MNYQLNIRDHNRQAHLDIEEEIKHKKNGLFTFILRVNNGNIVDCVIMENRNARDYLALKSITIEEYRITHNNRERSSLNPIRTNNIQHKINK